MATQTVAQMFVGGEWRDSLTGETVSATSPATGETIGTVPQGDREDAGGDRRRPGGRARLGSG